MRAPFTLRLARLGLWVVLAGCQPPDPVVGGDDVTDVSKASDGASRDEVVARDGPEERDATTPAEAAAPDLPATDLATVDDLPRVDTPASPDVGPASDVDRADRGTVVDVVPPVDLPPTSDGPSPVDVAPPTDTGDTCPPLTTRCGAACVDLATTLEHCGACARMCTLAHATARCAAGACAVASCEAGFADLDGNAANGCEAGLTPAPFPISDAQFVMHAYQTALAREPDPRGFETWIAALQGGMPRAAAFAGLAGSTEGDARGLASDRAGFVRRVYRTLLEREASDAEASAQAATIRDGHGGGAGALSWYELFNGVLASAEYGARPRPVAGVHVGIPVFPTLALTDGDHVAAAYQLVLNRAHDVGGFRANRSYLQSTSVEMLFAALAGSAEFRAQPALADRAGFVRRAYQTVLGRAASPAEVAAQLTNLREADGSGAGFTWAEHYLALTGSEEYRNGHCPTQYFTYDERLPRTTPLLRDLMSGTAHWGTVSASEVVALQFAPGGPVVDVWDQKLAIFRDRGTGAYWALTRGYLRSGDRFSMFLLRRASDAPPRWEQVGEALYAPVPGVATSFYDAQLTIDNTVCPPRYVATLECDGALCTSYSTTPTAYETWSPPRRVITPSSGPYLSASTGMSVLDHRRAYLSWTEVDDRFVWFETPTHMPLADEGTERTSTSAIALRDLYSEPERSVAAIGPSAHAMLAEANVGCSSAWDCNNLDAQDWDREGPFFYMTYNGANYYRCVRPPGDARSSQWGLSVARSQTATSGYTQRLRREQVMFALRADTCGISYPTITALDGALQLHYAHYDVGGGNSTRRARLQWR
jgi:hypothetical protein